MVQTALPDAPGNAMRVAVTFQNERLDLDVPEGRLLFEWHGPDGVGPTTARGLVDAALARPCEYPDLRQAVVPGDHVVIALGSDIADASVVVESLCDALHGAGVDARSITVLLTEEPARGLALGVPEGVSVVVHDPDDRTQLAYLATTSQERRIYLNRRLTDADFVVPVGRLGYDQAFGYGGPWSVIYPSLSDRNTLRSLRSIATDERPDRDRLSPGLAESAEVSWLLGCQFHVGVVAGVTGVAGVFAGLESAVRARGMEEVDRLWSFRAESRAELVVVGIGRPGQPTRIDDLAAGLATATHLVERGGKIVALSRAEGSIGPALSRLIDAGDPRSGPAALRGHEASPDLPAARQIARALAWADVYLLSALNPETVEDLGMIALDRPEDVRRLAASSRSSLVVSQADLARAGIIGEEDES